MNDLYCKDFEFLNKDNQSAYDNLKQSILKRSRLDLEFLQSFIEFSKTFGTTQYECIKYSHVIDKDNKTINYITFCAEYLGLSETTIKRLYLTYERFIVECDVAPNEQNSFSWALPLFNDMTLSKIFELLPCSLEQLRTAYDKDILSANMTVKQLREYVKSLKNGFGQAQKVLEQIEEEQEQDKQEDTSNKLDTYKKIQLIIQIFESPIDLTKDNLIKRILMYLHSISDCLVDEFNLSIDK